MTFFRQFWSCPESTDCRDIASSKEALVAQSVEHAAFNRGVQGSSPCEGVHFAKFDAITSQTATIAWRTANLNQLIIRTKKLLGAAQIIVLHIPKQIATHYPRSVIMLYISLCVGERLLFYQHKFSFSHLHPKCHLHFNSRKVYMIFLSRLMQPWSGTERKEKARKSRTGRSKRWEKVLPSCPSARLCTNTYGTPFSSCHHTRT